MTNTAIEQTDGIFSESEWAKIIAELELPPRQSDVVKCLFRGNSDKQIAKDLDISIPTVRTYFSRLFRKYDLNDREELILHIVHHFRLSCKKVDCPLNR